MKWQEPTAEDVKKFFASVVVDRASVYSAVEDQVSKVLAAVVLRIRGTVRAAGQAPLDKNTQRVPPEAYTHALVLTVFALLSGTPNFQFLMQNAQGQATGFGYAVERAEEWLKFVLEGGAVTHPEDEDLAEDDAAFSTIRGGSDSQFFDMTTDVQT